MRVLHGRGHVFRTRTRLQGGEPEDRGSIGGRCKIFFFLLPIVFRLALGPAQTANQGRLPLEVRRQGSKSNHIPHNTKVKNACIHIATSCTPLWLAHKYLSIFSLNIAHVLLIYTVAYSEIVCSMRMLTPDVLLAISNTVRFSACHF